MPGKSLPAPGQEGATPACETGRCFRETDKWPEARFSQAGMAAASSNAVAMSRMLTTPIRL
jgi:hypothetical protein